MSENAFQKLGLKDDFEIVLIQKPTYPVPPGETVAIASKELVDNCEPKEIYMSANLRNMVPCAVSERVNVSGVDLDFCRFLKLEAPFEVSG